MKYKLGDTLVEVTLAVGIFSMVAIAIAAVMNGSTSSAQAALEATLAREEIDAQSEAIRFIQNAYIADENKEDDRFEKLWNKIADQALNTNDNMEPITDFVNFGPTSCQKAYEKKDSNQTWLQYWKAFIVDPRALQNYSTIPHDEADEYIKQVFIQPADNPTNNQFVQAQTNPRLTYNYDQYNNQDNLIEQPSSTDTNLYRAEGIYVVAIEGDKYQSYYDFYVRTCWFGPGDDVPTSISTLFRLYNPGRKNSTTKNV